MWLPGCSEYVAVWMLSSCGDRRLPPASEGISRAPKNKELIVSCVCVCVEGAAGIDLASDACQGTIEEDSILS